MWCRPLVNGSIRRKGLKIQIPGLKAGLIKLELRRVIMKNSMAMVSGILLAMAVCLCGCKIVSATPDTETVIEVRPGDTVELKVSGLVDTPVSKTVWSIIYDDNHLQWSPKLERSDTFKITIPPDGGNNKTNMVKVRLDIYKPDIVPWNTYGCECITGCVKLAESDEYRVWTIRILQDTAPVWKGKYYHIWDSRDIELLKNYTTILGSLIIDDSRLENLDGLENLTSAGVINIRYNETLTNLSGLRGITSVIQLDIRNNTALTALGMTGLQRVNGALFIEDNPNLCGSLPEEFLNQILAGGGIVGEVYIMRNKEC
jgi:hypothetical protein